MSQNGEPELNPRELLAFKELKNIINEEFGLNTIDDNKMIRFLRAREYDVNQAYVMLKKNLEWRNKHHIDTISQDYVVPEIYAKYFSFNYIGLDEDFAIILTNFGKFDHKGLVKSSPSGKSLRQLTYILETCEQQMQERSNEVGGRPVDTWIVIVDMEGFSFTQMANKIVIGQWIEMALFYEANYPERLKIGLVINALTAVQVLFGILRPFITQKTIKKLHFYGKDGWKQELSKFIDLKALPAYLGGERKDPDGNPMCHSFVCHGGQIPEKFYMKNAGKSFLKDQPGVKLHELKRRSKFDVALDVQEKDSFIEWEFETDDHDIGFGLSFKSFDSNEDDEMVTLIPIRRFDSGVSTETGIFKCENPGIYIVTLDNSYSVLRSKIVYYKVSVVKLDEKKTDVSKRDS